MALYENMAESPIKRTFPEAVSRRTESSRPPPRRPDIVVWCCRCFARTEDVPRASAAWPCRAPRSVEEPASEVHLRLRKRTIGAREQRSKVRHELRERLAVRARRRRALSAEKRAQRALRALEPPPQPVPARHRQRARARRSPSGMAHEPRHHKLHEAKQRHGAHDEARHHRCKQHRKRSPATRPPVPIRAEKTATAHLHLRPALGIASQKSVPDQRSDPPAVRTRPELALREQLGKRRLV